MQTPAANFWPNGPAWQRGAHWRLRGQLLHNNRILSPADLDAALPTLDTPQALAQWLRHCAGSYALLFNNEKHRWAATDPARSIPLFWRDTPSGAAFTGRLSVADPGFEPRQPWWDGQWLSQVEYLPGNLTLDQRYQQLGAGQLAWQPQGGPQEVLTYFNYTRLKEEEEAHRSETEWKDQLKTILEQIISRLIISAAGRPLVVLLSGGYDSRLLLALLRQAGYPALYALTYGQAGAYEHQRAQATARQLGVPWVFVPYGPEVFQSFFSETWRAYADYASNLSVLPQDQDFFALAQARAQGLIPPDALLLPGYCADVQAGSYLPGRYFQWPGRLKAGALAHYIAYRLNAGLRRNERQMLWPHLPLQAYPQPEALIADLEAWFIRERMAKYVVNGVRASEFWGYGWRLPFWDPAFLAFWQQPPNVLRQHMKLYRHTLAETYFQPMGIHFPDDHKPQAPTWRTWAASAPGVGVRRLLLRRKPAPDINGFDWLNNQVRKITGAPPATMNETLGRWLHAHWQSRLKNHNPPEILP
jgi:asparagine synthase (glutamine-hydrolysing)